MPVQTKTDDYPITPIYSFSALKTKQLEVQERGKKEVVHITERGNAAYIFCSEEVLEREKARAVAQALEDAEIARLIRQGREDAANGDVIEGYENIMSSPQELWGRNDQDRNYQGGRTSFAQLASKRLQSRSASLLKLMQEVPAFGSSLVRTLLKGSLVRIA